MPDSRARVNLIAAAVGRELGTTGLARMLAIDSTDGYDILYFYINAGYRLWSLANPKGWRWQRYVTTKAAENESVALDSTLISATVLLLPYFGRWTVECKVSTGAYRTLEFLPWERFVEMCGVRVAHTARNQSYWSIQYTDNDTFNLETGPGSYAGTGSPVVYPLTVRIDALRDLPELTKTGANDDAKLLNPESEDIGIVRAAAYQVAMAIGSEDQVARTWNGFEVEAMARLRPMGINELGVEGPPARIYRAPTITEESGGE